MPSALPVNSSAAAAVNDAAAHPKTGSAKQLYFDLLRDADAAGECRQAARAFLHAQLQAAASQPDELPADPAALQAWMMGGVAAVGQQYRDYREARRQGAPRRYFSNKAHALYFLKAVAPTKLVDGAWLYGLLPRWRDARYTGLIRTYLEELGEGVAEQNHVAIYRRLLEAHGCTGWEALSDEHYTQGAIQLALAEHAAEFLPEVIGYNLGYEQLPLHLLITAYELDELGLDPYYFTLHVTVDNAASGHARKATQGVLEALPQAGGDAKAFYQRVLNGYKLNNLGTDTQQAIAGFELEQELVEVLTAKAAVGSLLHADYCRLGGRTVNEWLSEPNGIPAFLQALEASGWVQRQQDPARSRFWRLIQGDDAAMFGVFTAYEQQLIHDWIAGAWVSGRAHSFRHRALGRPASARAAAAYPARGVFRRHARPAEQAAVQDGFAAELRALEERLAALPDEDALMSELIRLMSPVHHHRAAGLMATRIFSRLV